MQRSEFVREPRGPRLFDTWTWAVTPNVAALAGLKVELQIRLDEQLIDQMLGLAEQLLAYVRGNDQYLLDLIYAHYLYAEQQGWLSFWRVPSGLGRSVVLDYVRSVALVVDSELVASVFVDPQWEQEHKLDMLYEGKITRVDGQPFKLTEGIL